VKGFFNLGTQTPDLHPELHLGLAAVGDSLHGVQHAFMVPPPKLLPDLR
jgi:hypothetical protein